MKRNFCFPLIAAVCMPLVASASSPYISKVFDYHPAPGQFINEIPEYEPGDTYESILLKVEEQLCGAARPGMISLGAFGGYVTFGFDHPIVNLAGEYDFKVNGNAIIAEAGGSVGGSEPGIILVSTDTNGNGLPDDEWYEIKGSEYDKESTSHDYQITYYRPADDHVSSPDPDNRHILDAEYIRWTDNASESGYLQRNDVHLQDYWPEWLDVSVESLTFTGERLASNAKDLNGDGSYFVLQQVGDGYADNYPSIKVNGIIDPGVKIDWAVKADGSPANLKSIDFVRVYTSMNQTCGWLGETSTEITGAEDLHPDLTSVESIDYCVHPIVVLLPASGELVVRTSFEEPVAFSVVSMTGIRMFESELHYGENVFDVSAFAKGVYLLVTEDGQTTKVAI